MFRGWGLLIVLLQAVTASRISVGPVLKGPEIVHNRFRFACTISFPRIPNIAFNVTWLFDSLDIPNLAPQILKGNQRVAYLDQEHWHGNIGKTLTCRVETYFITNPGVRGSPQTSNGYFGGIRVMPSVMTLRESGGPQQINVTSTLPVVCANSRRPCWIQLDIDVRGGSWEDITTGNQCLLLLTPDLWNPGTRTASISTTLQATRDVVVDGDQELHVTFIPNYNNAPKIWLGYRPPDLRVYTVDGQTAKCSVFADPHVMTFEGRRTLHLYDAGDYIMLRSTRRMFEVDIRTNECIGKACVCAVAIMEDSDVLSIDVCKQTWGAPPARVKILSGDRLAPGTRIQRTPDGRNFLITFASGAWMKVQDFATYLNVEVQVPAEDFGFVQGICGSFDGKPDNELTGPQGVEFPLNNSVPTRFFDSWRLNPHQTLLNGPIRPDNTRVGKWFDTDFISRTDGNNMGRTNVDEITQCLCHNLSRTADCGVNRVIQDPVLTACPECKDVTTDVIFRTQNTSIEDHYDDERNWIRIDNVTPNFRKRINFNITATININVSVLLPGHNPQEHDHSHPVEPMQPQISRARAYEICRLAMLNFTLGTRCASILNLKSSGFITSCVEDMVTAQSTVFLQAAVSAMEAGCQEVILRNITNYGTDDNGRRVPPREVLRQCPNQCSLNGRCVDGRCKCNPGFTAPDCSVQAARPPFITRILRSGLCNARRRPCRIAFLIVNNFHETPNIACRIRDVQVHGTSLTPNENRQTVPADFQSSREVGCHLPDPRVPEEQAINAFLISLTTDGTRFSNEALYVVYDSTCLTCNSDGECGILTEMCMIDGRCWRGRDENPVNTAERCQPNHDQENWTREMTPESFLSVHRETSSCVQKNRLFDRWDIWTSNVTGCPCLFDKGRPDCACCEAGACQCHNPYHRQCARCGQELRLCGKRQKAPGQGIDGFTRTLSGCRCQFNPLRMDCACCQNGGCPCGIEHKNQCVPCGQREVCGAKPDVFGGLKDMF